MGRVFAVPAVLAAVSIVGLVAALLGDGPLDAVSWAGLGIPVAAIGWALARRRQ